MPTPSTLTSPAKSSAPDAQLVKGGVPPSQQKEGAQLEPVAKVAVAAPKTGSAPGADDDDEDLEISDEEGMAAEGDGSEVDEDWGGDWE